MPSAAEDRMEAAEPPDSIRKAIGRNNSATCRRQR